jgi:hypothetical protein
MLVVLPPIPNPAGNVNPAKSPEFTNVFVIPANTESFTTCTQRKLPVTGPSAASMHRPPFPPCNKYASLLMLPHCGGTPATSSKIRQFYNFSQAGLGVANFPAGQDRTPSPPWVGCF